jgi:hypothetical protein
MKKVIIEKQVVTQLLKKLPAFYGTRIFIAVLIWCCIWILSWAKRID